MKKKIIKCERCGEKLVGPYEMLELSITDGKYYRYIPEGHISQGAFFFGIKCARQQLEDTTLSSEAQARERHVEKINAAIDAIINLEDFYPLPNALSAALSKLNSMRSRAEEEIEPGDEVWDSHNKEYGIVESIGAVNFFLTASDDKPADHLVIGKQFCFKT